MRTCLVTGGAGFIGSNLIDSLIEDYRIICVDDFNSFLYYTHFKIRNIINHKEHENYRLYNVDLKNYEEIEKIFKINHIDMVIHLAGHGGVRPSIENPILYTENNVNSTVNLLELCKKYSVKKFLFASSSSVYGLNDVPWNEDQKIHPISPYAATKISCEKLCHVYANLYDMKITCLRFFTVFGPRQRPDLAIHKFLNWVHTGQEIKMFGDGTTKRDYTYIMDIIMGIKAAMVYDSSHYEIFNLGNNRTVELREVIDIVENVIGKKAVIKKLPEQPGDVPITYADIDKSKKLLSYDPITPIEDGIKEQWEYQLINWM